jgi:hypothetical protein
MTSAQDSAGNTPNPDPAPGATSPEPETAEPDSSLDEQHRLFREALERKKSASHGSAGGAADGGHGSIGHGAGAKTQRMFRRKSG